MTYEEEENGRLILKYALILEAYNKLANEHVDLLRYVQLLELHLREVSKPEANAFKLAQLLH